MKLHQLFGSLLLLLASNMLFAQKKPIEMEDIHRWKSIEKQVITANGDWVAYQVKPVSEGDAEVRLWNNGKTISFPRAEQPEFSEDGQWLVCTLKPPFDTIRALKRKKVKADDLPKDTLMLYQLSSGTVTKFPRVKGYTMPEFWSGWLAVHLEAPPKPKEDKKEKAAPKDSTIVAVPDSTQKKPEKTEKAEKPDKSAKPKKESADNGTLLLIHNLATGRSDTIPFVVSYTFAKRKPAMAFHTTGTADAAPEWKKNTAVAMPGVYFKNLEKNEQKHLRRGKAKYKQLSLDEQGEQAAFLVDADTSKAVIRPWQLAYTQTAGKDTATVYADNSSNWLPEQPENSTIPGKWILSDLSAPSFSKDGEKMFFGIVPPPGQPDTTLLPEEVAKVEVWSSASPYLYTNLETRLKNDLKRTWPVVCYPGKKPDFVPLADPSKKEMRILLDPHRSSKTAIGLDDEPYAIEDQWQGESGVDVYKIDLETGAKSLIIKNILGDVLISPKGNHAIYWSLTDTAWYIHPLKGGSAIRLTSNALSPFYDTESDVPNYPENMGIAGWTDDEKAVLLYDEFDIWRIPVFTREAAMKITNGRPTKTRYRLIKLDPEAITINEDDNYLLHAFNDNTKKESYWQMNLKTRQLTPWQTGDYTYSRSPQKAKKSNHLLFTRQNFDVFPDLTLTTLPWDAAKNTVAAVVRVSDVNPQQSEYAWPSISMVKWLSLTGDTLSGLVIRPAGYDPKKQYPMIVNFYEKLSDGLYQHRAPSFGRSQISHTQYASRGYVVFLPDIPYRIGYPGESAYNAIVSGTTWMIQQGGIDPKRVALQGHSWGGYQAAYIITKTNMFKCVEAGAAVVNMTSAYGGIRWESGLNRQFQYEHQQSRIGGSLWEKPMLYLENSPLFSMNKVETPVLILHNDKDGAVPWEQGLEYFTALRRLGKPAWMLNYNDEPHWPVKLPNRIDFQKRMQQFFDYYLLNAPMPRWMEKGIPPLEKEYSRD